MYKYLFGPVPSRRLGMSLGVDLIPKKICTLDCVYCEIGKTTDLTVERKSYFDQHEVMAEIDDYFEKNPDPEYITFSGSGEPTLYIDTGEVLQFIKRKKQHIPVAVLTNGTLFSDPYVRKSILNADMVLPSLDAATDRVFRKINRPHKSLSVRQHIKGLIDFRSEFKGKICLEVFILPGYNDDEEELKEIRNALALIQPDAIHLNTLDRPGALPNLRGATREELQHVHDFFGMDQVEIVASVQDRKSVQSYRSDMESAILETISRRPCTLDDLSRILGLHVNEINKYLSILEGEKRIEASVQARGVFYQAH